MIAMALHLPEPSARRIHAGSFVLSLSLHGAFVLCALRSEVPPQVPPIVTEVQLAPAARPVAREAPPAPPEAPAAATVPREPPVRARPRAPTSELPQPARAPAVRTVDEAVPSAGEPVRFSSDARGGAFGFGVVAAGSSGSGEGGAGERASAPAIPASAPGLLPSFAQPPALKEADPCRGFFPAAAKVDRGASLVRVSIAADGRVENVEVLSEQPAAQGFGAATRACLRSKRFVPARAEDGRKVPSRVPVQVKFSR